MSKTTQPPTYYNACAHPRTTRMQHNQPTLYQAAPMSHMAPSYSCINSMATTASVSASASASSASSNNVPPSIMAPFNPTATDPSIMAIIRDHPSFDQSTAKTYNKYRNKNGKNPHNTVAHMMKVKHINNNVTHAKRSSNQQIIQNMIPNMQNIKRENVKREKKHTKNTMMNVPTQVQHDANVVYNAVCIEDIFNQIKTAMDHDPEPDRVKHENYVDLIQRYFRCELSKFSLDWFMHKYYRRYIKLHNAMFKYIRWNATLQSTNADAYGLGALSADIIHTQHIDNYPKLNCKQSQENKLFRGPPHKKRKLNMPKQIHLDYVELNQNQNQNQNQIKNVSHKKKQIANNRETEHDHIEDFDETMDKLQQKNPKLFQDVLQWNADKEEVIKIEIEDNDHKTSIKDNLPSITSNTDGNNNKKSAVLNNKTNRRRIAPINKKASHKSFPLQLEVKDIDEESLKRSNIIKLYHHNEQTNTLRYIMGTNSNINHNISDLDAIQFEAQLKERNITSTNCVNDASVSKPLPCDAMYLSKQHVLEICNQLIRRRNFLNNGEKQREIISVKENYEKEWKREQQHINSNKARKEKFVASFNAEIGHLKDELHNSLLQPINDANIIDVLMEKGLKPMLAALHCKAIQHKQQEQNKSMLKKEDNARAQTAHCRIDAYAKDKDADERTSRASAAKQEKVIMHMHMHMDESDHSDTDSDEDIPINERLKNEKEQKVEQRTISLRIHRSKNISKRLKQRLSIAPHEMISINNNNKRRIQRIRKEKEENHDRLQTFAAMDIRRYPIAMESERRLQLAAMIDIDAADTYDTYDDDECCWMYHLNAYAPYTVHAMADVPHAHECGSGLGVINGIHDCLLSDERYDVALATKEEIQQSNIEWKKHNLLIKNNKNNNNNNNVTENKNIICSSPHVHNVHRKGRSRITRIAAAGKGRKSRSAAGKGVSGKSLTRSMTSNALHQHQHQHQHQQYTSNTTGASKGTRNMVWSNTHTHRSAAAYHPYRQRLQSQRMYTPQNVQQNNISTASSTTTHRHNNRILNSQRQRLQRYNANYQRLRNQYNANHNQYNNSSF